ncbi:hypothetical protein GCM10025734_10860 [Kitasatospora paranensis]
MQARGVGPVRVAGGAGRGGDDRAEVPEGAQQSGRGAQPLRVGLVVDRVLQGEAGEALGDAEDQGDREQQPDGAAGAEGQQQGAGGDLPDAADQQLAADRVAASGGGGDQDRRREQRQLGEPGLRG